jgi:hypothetical protein
MSIIISLDVFYEKDEGQSLCEGISETQFLKKMERMSGGYGST